MKRNVGGFTLIELMVTIAIVGVLSSVAMVSLEYYKKKVIFLEARLNMGYLIKEQIAFYDEYQEYTLDFDDLLIEMPKSTIENTRFTLINKFGVETSVTLGFEYIVNPYSSGSFFANHIFGADMRLDSAGNPGVGFYWYRQPNAAKTGAPLWAGGGFMCCKECTARSPHCPLGGSRTYYTNGWPNYIEIIQ